MNTDLVEKRTSADKLRAIAFFSLVILVLLLLARISVLQSSLRYESARIRNLESELQTKNTEIQEVKRQAGLEQAKSAYVRDFYMNESQWLSCFSGEDAKNQTTIYHYGFQIRTDASEDGLKCSTAPELGISTGAVPNAYRVLCSLDNMQQNLGMTDPIEFWVKSQKLDVPPSPEHKMKVTTNQRFKEYTFHFNSPLPLNAFSSTDASFYGSYMLNIRVPLDADEVTVKQYAEQLIQRVRYVNLWEPRNPCLVDKDR